MRLIILYMSTILYSYDMSTILYDYDIICDVYVYSRDVCVYSRDVCVYSRDVYVPYDIVLHMIYDMMSLVLGDFSSGPMMLTEVSDCLLTSFCILPRFLAFSELSSFSTAMSLSFSAFLLVFSERFPCPLFYLALVDLDEEQKEKETIEMSVEMCLVTFTLFYWTCSIVLYCHVIYGMVSLVQGDFSSGPDDATEVSDCSLSTVGISYGFLVFRLYRGRKVSGFASDLPPLLLPVFPLSYWHR